MSNIVDMHYAQHCIAIMAADGTCQQQQEISYDSSLTL